MDKCVHTEHCCHTHGCKYGDLDCPVKAGRKPQSYPCEHCNDDHLYDEEYRQYAIYHWCKSSYDKPIDNCKKMYFNTDAGVIEIWGVLLRDSELLKFVEKYGNIKLSKPTKFLPYFIIWVTDSSGSFSQR
jgi:hypothetical protein